jgi:hypothetical protein
MLATIFLIIGLIIGTRVGLKGLIMFCGGIGLIYILIRVPLSVYGFVIEKFPGSNNAELVAGLLLIGSLVMVLWSALQLAVMLIEVLCLDVLPEGINRSVGGALGGALGWILIKIIF